MHPMAGLCVLHGLSLYTHTMWTSEWRVRVGTHRDTAMLICEPYSAIPWTATRFLGGIDKLRPANWADVPNRVMDQLTPALIQQISST